MKALLDANVLYPTVLREILIGVAREELFTPIWSDRILEEWARATVKLGPGAEIIARGEISVLRSDFPRASVMPPDGLADRLWLTPACGLAGLTPRAAQDVHRRALDVARELTDEQP